MARLWWLQALRKIGEIMAGDERYSGMLIAACDIFAHLLSNEGDKVTLPVRLSSGDGARPLACFSILSFPGASAIASPADACRRVLSPRRWGCWAVSRGSSHAASRHRTQSSPSGR